MLLGYTVGPWIPNHLGEGVCKGFNFLYEQMGGQDPTYLMYTCQRNKIILVVVLKVSQSCI